MYDLKEILKYGITVTWRVEDVMAVFDAHYGDSKEFTEEQAAEVLAHVLKNHDANEGITWETLEAAIEALFF